MTLAAHLPRRKVSGWRQRLLGEGRAIGDEARTRNAGNMNEKLTKTKVICDFLKQRAAWVTSTEVIAHVGFASNTVFVLLKALAGRGLIELTGAVGNHRFRWKGS